MRRRVSVRLFLAATVVLLTGIAGAQADPTEARGKEIYKTHCLECHGESGAGDGDKAKRLGFRPRDFTLGSFKCRCTPSGALPSDDDLMRVVARGLPGTSMRGFEKLVAESDRRAVVEYLKSLSPAFERPIPDCIEIPEPIPASSETRSEGRQVYRLLRCWSCHGLEGKGDGPAAKGLVDDWGDRIRVYNFTRPRRYKCGGSESDLFRLLHTGMSGSPMPSFTTALGFAGEAVGDLTALADALGHDAVAELSTYVGSQPDGAALEAMTEDDRHQIANRRTWALVHYLESLVQR
ncbi:MAG: c-type cytochrome [Thermoanaerobaculia bacterium]